MSKNIISNAVFILCVLCCFIFSLISYIQFSSSDYVYVSSIGRNWSNGPISDVEASGYDCPSGKSPAIVDFWLGTVSGCSCPALIGDGLSRSACSRRSYACSNVYQLGAIPYRIWRGSNLCVKRGPNYLDLKTGKSSNDCGSGYKSCGIADSLNQVLCYPNNVECPYNFVKVLSPSEQVPKDVKYTVVPLGFNSQEGKILFSNENTSGKTLIQFKVDDNTPCLSPDYRNLEIKPYYLEKTWDMNSCQNEIGGQRYDNSYTKIDSESYNRLYSDNQILGILLSLPQFQNYNYLSGATSLYSKNFIGFNKQCVSKLLGNKPSSLIIQDLVQIEDKIGSVSTVALVGMIFGIIGFVIIIIFSCIFCCGGGDTEGLKFLSIISVIFISIPALIISAILVSKANNIGYDLSLFADPYCTDSITSNAVGSFSSKINSGISMSVTYLIFSILALVCNVFSFFV